MLWLLPAAALPAVGAFATKSHPFAFLLPATRAKLAPRACVRRLAHYYLCPQLHAKT